MIIQTHIETLIFFTVVIFFLCWFAWYKISKWLAIKKYNPKNDKGKIGEEHRREKKGRREISDTSTAVVSDERFGESKERSVLPTTNVVANGKDSNSSRKVRRTSRTSRFGKIFRRK